MPVWETLVLDAAGTLVTLATAAAAGWLLHRTGRLAALTGPLGRWLAANTATVEADALQALRDLLEHQHAIPAPAAADHGHTSPAAAPAVTGGPLHPEQAEEGGAVARFGPLVQPPTLVEGATITVRRPDGATASYTVEGVAPGQMGASYRLRPSLANPGINLGDTDVPGSSRGAAIHPEQAVQGDAGWHGGSDGPVEPAEEPPGGGGRNRRGGLDGGGAGGTSTPWDPRG